MQGRHEQRISARTSKSDEDDPKAVTASGRDHDILYDNLLFRNDIIFIKMFTFCMQVPAFSRLINDEGEGKNFQSTKERRSSSFAVCGRKESCAIQ